MARILLIDDDPSITLALKTLFEREGYGFLSAPTGRAGLEAALRELPEVTLLDLCLPDMHGLDVLREIKAENPELLVIVITGSGEVKEAVQAMMLGAGHYFQKPVDLDELSIMIDKNVSYVKLREEARLWRDSQSPIVGRSRAILKIKRIIGLLAENPSATVLIQGETGTGKELAARNIHFMGARAEGPFVEINCASIPESIFESELFGHEAGAFTDARGTKKGLIEVADGGTLFLDEVAEMPHSSQAKLLRFIETRTFRRLGATRDIKVDVRVLAATNRDLQEAAGNGSFREDLFYRLNVFPLEMPALRERPEDLPLLARYFADKISAGMGRKAPFISEGTMALLQAYGWPGNVRELRNVLERALILSAGGPVSPDCVLLAGQRQPGREGGLTLEEAEKVHIKKVLGASGGNRSAAARTLGISRSTLAEKIKRHNIT